MRPRLMLATTLLALLTEHAAGHASLIMPVPRNAVDNDPGTPWSGGQHPATGWMQPYTCACTNGSEPTCNSGQACFWFSQGCTIGCSKCDGQGARIPNWDHCPNESIRPTVNDPRYLTMNQNATPGSPQDIFKFNPWRAPGRAPVFDPCGKAGGSDSMSFNAGAYNTTIYAKQGDLGSVVLKPRPSGTVWKRGAVEKARWEYTASHGGGYQYRLCPANKPLTEDCFKAMPLRFAEPHQHTVVFAARTVDINATVVPHSVTGTGDWMKNPIPSFASDYVACDYVVPPGNHCDWKCPGCGPPTYAADSACPCQCAEKYPQYFPSGHAYVGSDKNWFDNPPNLPNFAGTYREYSIEDSIVIPSDIPAGDYVLGWRWDCEQTTQIWANCADITIE
eukprot:m.92554 g.92554  ORF g.92554 m.92554 type:complete len:391 (-) comp9961_c0_seq3:1265-2437(-)